MVGGGGGGGGGMNSRPYLVVGIGLDSEGVFASEVDGGRGLSARSGCVRRRIPCGQQKGGKID
jgi:hypothetical protein